MKKLFAILLSFSFILPPGLVSQAHAVDVGSNASYDEQSQIYRQSGKQGGYDFYAKQILTLSTSIIGSNIITQCSFGLKVPSIATFMAGSLVHVGSELLGAKAENDRHNSRLNDLKLLKENLKTEGGEIQKELLIQSKKTEEQTLEFIKNRKKWMIAVTAIYAAAAGLAILEETMGHTAGMGTGTPICAAGAAAAAAGCTVGAAACYAAYFAPCMAAMPAGALSAEASFSSPTALATGTTTCTGTAVFAGACSSYLASYMALAYGNCLPLSPDGGLLNQLKSMAIVAAYNMGVSKTGQGGKVASYGVMLTTLFSFILPAMDKLVMAAYNFPMPRVVTFGASSVLAGTVTAGLIQRQSMVEKNISDLNRVITNFKVQTDEYGGLGTDEGAQSGSGSGDDINAGNGPKYDIKALPTVAPVKNCMSSQGNNFEFSPKACANPIKLNKGNYTFNTGFQTLNQAGSLAADMANAISSGDMARADVVAGQLGSMAAKINDINKNLRDAYNKKQKLEKKNPLDFDKSINDRIASMQKSLETGAASKGVDLASLGPALNGTDSSKEAAPEVIAAVPAPTIPTPDTSMDLNMGMEETTPEEPQAEKVANLEQSLGDYETNVSDISKDSGASIFKQVSHRYFLNYTKIFQRKEIAPPLEKSEKLE